MRLNARFEVIFGESMDSNDKDFVGTSARSDKTLSWLKVSRDAWKEKARESKAKLKIMTLATKRARDSRDEAEKELRNKQEQLNQKCAEVLTLKNKLEQATLELEKLKKKR